MSKICWVIVILNLAITIDLAAQDLLITPKRVVFEGNKQREELNLVNIGKDTATFTVSFIQYRMTEEGSMEIISNPDSNQLFADSYLRVFPRKVILAPREPQLLILQLRKKPEMKSGEYRSHLYFRADKNEKPLGFSDKPEDTTLLSVQLIPIYGLSIPVIIRIGESFLSCSISDIELNTLPDSSQNLSLSINRKGNISSYGDLKIFHISQNGTITDIGEIKGIGVYTNLNKRKVSIKLKKQASGPINRGKIIIKYFAGEENKQIVLAESELILK